MHEQQPPSGWRTFDEVLRTSVLEVRETDSAPQTPCILVAHTFNFDGLRDVNHDRFFCNLLYLHSSTVTSQGLPDEQVYHTGYILCLRIVTSELQDFQISGAKPLLCGGARS